VPASFAPGTSALPPPARSCMRLLRNTMAVDANAVADCVLAAFDQLEDKRKPRPRNDGSREWVPLAGIVLSKGRPVASGRYPTKVADTPGSSEDGKLSCISLG
jgi:hypothetical protein